MVNKVVVYIDSIYTPENTMYMYRSCILKNAHYRPNADELKFYGITGQWNLDAKPLLNIPCTLYTYTYINITG